MPFNPPPTSVGLPVTLPTTAATPHYTTAQRRDSSRIPSLLPIQKPVPRTKSLTCSYWHEGHCKYTEEQCLYSHHPTGKVASPPQQVEQGRSSPNHHGESKRTLTDTGPAVAGRNASRKNPEYKPWRVLWKKIAPMEPHVEQQIQSIHDRYRNDKFTTSAEQQQSISSSPIVSPMLYVSGTQSRQQLSPPNILSVNADYVYSNPHNQARHYIEDSSHNMLSGMPTNVTSPSYVTLLHKSQPHRPSNIPITHFSPPSHPASESPENAIRKMAKMIDNLFQHLLFCRDALGQQSQEALIALCTFESGYERKPDTTEMPLTSCERFRAAMGHVMYISHHHQLTLEDLETGRNTIYGDLTKTGQEGLLPHTWKKSQIEEETTEEEFAKSEMLDQMETRESRL